MAWTDYLDNPITYRLLFEAVVTFAAFGGFLGIFWILGEMPWLQFSLDVFLKEYGLVFFLGVVIYRAVQNLLQVAMKGM
ncbi:hypothetical protein KY092_08230 [Natronomonas gomsonensis]|uniref:hypothetical protein n=1 Tax=Natronomonas gomsonensis TaxID=1046043 RepID=UPI0020CA8B32|nr:hypothetical protein [Natronomonas gomsonensis]MCY4730545.1 hypothetical protein [Natronomonas gomsonensis]